MLFWYHSLHLKIYQRLFHSSHSSCFLSNGRRVKCLTILMQFTLCLVASLSYPLYLSSGLLSVLIIYIPLMIHSSCRPTWERDLTRTYSLMWIIDFSHRFCIIELYFYRPHHLNQFINIIFKLPIVPKV